MSFAGKCVHYLSLAQTLLLKDHIEDLNNIFPNQIVKILLQLVGDSAYNNVCECLWIRDVCEEGEVGGNDGLESFNDGNNKLMKVLIVCDEWKIQHTSLLLSLSPSLSLRSTASHTFNSSTLLENLFSFSFHSQALDLMNSTIMRSRTPHQTLTETTHPPGIHN